MNDDRRPPSGSQPAEVAETVVAEREPRVRRPYQRPRVEKRRSLIQATLLSGGASGGSAPTGSGG